MKKSFICILIFAVTVLTGCSNYSKIESDSKVSKYEGCSDIFKIQYESLEKFFLDSNRSLECNEEETVEYEELDSTEKLIKKMNETGCFSLDLLNEIDELNNLMENCEFENSEELESAIDNLSLCAESKLTTEDFQIFTTYVETSKAATAFYVDNIDDSDSSRSLKSIWKKFKKRIVNFAISVGAGAVIGATVGFISTGNIGGVIAGAVAVATYCGAKSASSGNIVIGMEIKV